MNEEEVLNTFLLANIPEIITQEEFDDVKKAIRELQQENQKHKEVIDKMNKLLQQEQDAMTTKFHYDIVGLINALLDILKEVE